MNSTKLQVVTAHLIALTTLVMRSIFSIIAAFVAFTVGAFSEAPARVVSVNLCTDLLAMMLTSPEQLVSVTYLAQDPVQSPLAENARAFQANNAHVEELYLLKPDFVLAGEWTPQILLSTLDELKIPYKQYAPPRRLDDVPAYVLQMGKDLGREEKAQAIIDDFNARLKALDAAPRGSFSSATFGARGYTGDTDSLAGEIIARAGFVPINKKIGLSDGGRMSLEALITAHPDVVLLPPRYAGASNGEALMGHPALETLTTYELQTSRSLNCGTPFVLDTYAELIKLNQELAR